MTQTKVKPNYVDLKTLYDRLKQIGFNRDFVKKKLLPDWWDNDFEATQSAVVEAAAYVSRRTNLDMRSLLYADSEPFFQESGHHEFKVRQGTIKNELQVAQNLCDRVAEIVSYACITDKASLVSLSAQEVRKQILSSFPTVTMEGLLDFCWKNGIPTVHVNKFPKNQKKFDGMVGYFYERPVITVCQKRKSAAWLSFTIAHELGHIVKGHITEYAIVDEKIRPSDSEVNETEGIDDREIESNEFALEVLFGKKDANYYLSANLSSSDLIDYAEQCSLEESANPSAVVLNYAWYKEKVAITKKEKEIIWAVAQIALHHFEPDSNAPVVINNYLRQYLDLENLSYDNRDYLEQMTAEEV